MPSNEIDEHAATELQLFIENDGDLYRQQTTPIMKNLMTKMAQGTYRKSMAPKLWGYLVDAGAKKYNREMGGGSLKWNEMFDKPTRTAVAGRMAREFEHSVLIGEYDSMIGQWVPKKYQGDFTTGKTARMANPGGRHQITSPASYYADEESETFDRQPLSDYKVTLGNDGKVRFKGKYDGATGTSNRRAVYQLSPGRWLGAVGETEAVFPTKTQARNWVAWLLWPDIFEPEY